MNTRRALIIVDLNNDFFPGGALAVGNAPEVLQPINELAASGEYHLVVATQDWHPNEHASFGKWPPHCVAGAPGAELHPFLDQTNVDGIIRKGFDQDIDSYSAFYNDRGETNGLAELLKARGVNAVDIAGLATDYCVRGAAIDAAQKAGFQTRVLLRACRGVNLNEGDVDQALADMREAGVELVH